VSSEAKVGIFVFLGMVLLFLLATQVGSFQNLSKKGYSVYADFENVVGLDINSKVKANGIDVGYIQSLKIQANKVRADIFLYEGMKIPKDSTLKPEQESMLGGKYVALTLGDSEEFIKDGDELKCSKASKDFNDASNAISEAAIEFKALTKELRAFFSGDTKASLQMTFSNLESITTELKSFTQLNRLNKTADNFNAMAVKLTSSGESFNKIAENINSKLPTILTNLDILVKDLKFTSSQIRSNVPELTAKFKEIEDEIQALISENKEPVNKAINSANSFFNVGTETFAKVDNLLNTIDKVQLEIAMYQQYMTQDEANKGFISFDYIPSDTKRFQFEIANTGDYTRLDAGGNFIKPKTHEEGEFLFSAQIAKRYDDLVLRTGLIENTAGAGADYYFLNDKLKTSAQIYDFNAVNDIRGDKPRAKISARYTFLKHIDIYGGYDNFLNKQSDNVFVGAGIRFFDNDIKTLIMSQSLGALAK